MTTARSGIPTEYAGVQFRSRLEAKWAAFFDLVGWSWTYEPFDAPGYIPDFLIAGDRSFLIEVGPVSTLAEYREKALKPDGVAVVLGRDLLVVGVSPVVPFDLGNANPAAGWLGELYRYPGRATDPRGFTWATGLWGKCYDCGSIGVVHAEMSYHLRPCGHHQSGSFGEPIPADWLTALWRRAGNDTQWAARGVKSVGAILRALQ